MTDWQSRLEAVIADAHVPGATLGILHNDEVTVYAAGVINKNTGVDVTNDTLFQIGSMTKAWTATLVMMLVDDGVLDLDVPVVTYLPELKLGDAEVTKTVTLRDLLSHRSGIGGDHFIDTGRGDDTLERYIETLGDIGQDHDLGATMSYCNTGYSIAGRVIEKVTGKVWDDVLRERIIRPLGLTHTNTLPEEALLFRTAVGHIKLPGNDDFQVSPVWMLPRACGPMGLVNAQAADALAFAKLHLDEGRGPDGKQLLSVASVKQMQEAQIEVPDKYTLGDRWGVGWILFDWEGHPVYGHDGATLGQRAYLRIIPEARLAVAVLTNGGESHKCFDALCREVVQELAGITKPKTPPLPQTAPDVDLSKYEGTFGRLNIDIDLQRNDEGGLTGTIRSASVLKDLIPDDEEDQKITAKPVDASLFLASDGETDALTPLVFFDFDGDTPRRVHFGARAMTRR
jgi:CubicO group peptidase (beta-lactamase class C family)